MSKVLEAAAKGYQIVKQLTKAPTMQDCDAASAASSYAQAYRLSQGELSATVRVELEIRGKKVLIMATGDREAIDTVKQILG